MRLIVWAVHFIWARGLNHGYVYSPPTEKRNNNHVLSNDTEAMERRGAVLMPYFDLPQKHFFVTMQTFDFRLSTLCFKDVYFYKCECLDTHLTIAKLEVYCERKTGQSFLIKSGNTRNHLEKLQFFPTCMNRGMCGSSMDCMPDSTSVTPTSRWSLCWRMSDWTCLSFSSCSLVMRPTSSCFRSSKMDTKRSKWPLRCSLCRWPFS